LEWKLDPGTKTRGRPIEDPAAWLIRAIERDYKPPSAFETQAEREKRRQELARVETERDKRRQELRAKREQESAHRLGELKTKYGTTQRELDLWGQVLKEIELQTTKATYQTWFRQTQLLAIKDGVAVIAVPNQMAQEWLGHRLHKTIERTLERLLATPVEVDFEVIPPTTNLEH